MILKDWALCCLPGLFNDMSSKQPSGFSKVGDWCRVHTRSKLGHVLELVSLAHVSCLEYSARLLGTSQTTLHVL